MVIVILFVLGLCLGSFVNAFVWRFHRQAELRDEQAALRAQAKKSAGKRAAQLDKELAALSISKGRSMCVHCHHELAAKDLIPVISYVWLRGKCRYCRRPIQDTPLAELTTPLLFVVSYLYWPYAFHGIGLVTFCFWLAFLVGFVMLALYDLRWYELPHDIVFWLICLAVVQVTVVAILSGTSWNVVAMAAWGGLVMVGVFGLLYRLSPQATTTNERKEDAELDTAPVGIGTRALGLLFGWLLGDRPSRWIGGGDVTLGLLLGLLVGGPANALLLIFVASLVGTLVALPLLLTGRANRTSHLPFGPFLLAGAIIVILWGRPLIDWYTSQFVG